jgi:hypothetical protein
MAQAFPERFKEKDCFAGPGEVTNYVVNYI